MPTDAEFQAFWDERLAQKRTTRPKLAEALRNRWPVKADRMACYDWSDAIADKRLNEWEMTNISPGELMEMLATMNFNSDIDRGKLESTGSNESDDYSYTGFVFHRVGNLEYWADDPENLRSYEDAAKGTWLPTQFHVVVYDFYPEGEYLEERRKIDDDDWGYLPRDLTDQQIALAKIVNKIKDLGFGCTFDFAEALDYPVELVRAMKTRKIPSFGLQFRS
ncbi:MAG: hypothetical protein M1840_002371 [Geoglossum simile]|nr:MAG: hypothetical protein M1840_002371 [Geoglossum simile]